MGCARGLCTSDKIFIFINIAFAMYSGALLATAARLAWDPSTYTWFRFLCVAQYRVSAAYVLAAGLWLAALVAGAVWVGGSSHQRALRWYSAGVGALLLSQLAVGAWLCASLAAWWRNAPQAELARRGLDLLHDLKPALLAVERYRDVARPLYDMIEEVEREAPNNAYVIVIFGLVALVLEVTALVMAWRMSRRSEGARLVRSSSLAGAGPGAADDDSDGAEPPASRSPPPSPGWRKTANLRMYTILDKIF